MEHPLIFYSMASFLTFYINRATRPQCRIFQHLASYTQRVTTPQRSLSFLNDG